MPLTLAQAAAETGLHRSSILRAIKRGTVSGTRDDSGQWVVEPAELFRVFPPAVRTGEPADATRQLAQADTAALAHAHERAAQAEQGLSELKAMLADMKADRDRWRDQADAWRDQAQASQKQLTDQREREPQSWWRWLRSTG
jgi:uncharacterized NAD(P)/FAD-binding protein YdhS